MNWDDRDVQIGMKWSEIFEWNLMNEFPGDFICLVREFVVFV
jgi:hypothetical protein